MVGYVIIAVRGGKEAKSRCGARLSGAQRERLAAAMLRDMLEGLRGAASVSGVYVATPTAALGALARACGAEFIPDPRRADLNDALEHARRLVASVHPGAILALAPGDLPCLRGADADALIAAARDGRIALAPSKDGLGTGGIAQQAGVPLSLAFGPASFASHVANVLALGLSPRIVRNFGFAFDVDQAEDIDVLLEGPPDWAPHSRRVLETSLALEAAK